MSTGYFLLALYFENKFAFNGSNFTFNYLKAIYKVNL